VRRGDRGRHARRRETLSEARFTRIRGTLILVNRGPSQNITLALPRQVLQRVKLLAVRRQTSVSGLLAAQLEELVAQDDAYHRAHRRHVERMKHPPDLGTRGKATWTREELHAR
jgi:hypothetical protein